MVCRKFIKFILNYFVLQSQLRIPTRAEGGDASWWMTGLTLMVMNLLTGQMRWTISVIAWTMTQMSRARE